MAVGTLALIVTAAFATKASKKFANQYTGTLYYGASASNVTGEVIPGCSQALILYTTNATGHTVKAPFLGAFAIGNNGTNYQTLYY
jgi:hypothetical protein